MLNFPIECKDWTEDVGLNVSERRLNSLENVENVSLERCKTFLNQLEAGRAIFLQMGDKFPDSSDVEFSKNVTENLENISSMTQSNICVLYNASGKNCLPADERHSYPGSETSVGNVIHTVLRSDDEVFKFVLGDE